MLETAKHVDFVSFVELAIISFSETIMHIAYTYLVHRKPPISVSLSFGAVKFDGTIKDFISFI